MGESGGRAATGPPPLVAIHHPHGDRARTLAAAVAAAGFGTMLLPPFAGAASDWRDGCFDCLVLDPFGGTQPPRELILLARGIAARSEEHTSELQSLMRISYAVFCLKKKNKHY